MKILNCKIKFNDIVYEVETNKHNNFSYVLPKDTPSYEVRKILKMIENKVDNETENSTDKRND